MQYLIITVLQGGQGKETVKRTSWPGPSDISAILRTVNFMRFRSFLLVSTFALLGVFAGSAQTANPPAQSSESQPAQQTDEVSGMYSFLREGEFVQVTLEDGVVTGFVSRYGDADSDKGSFLDQFFSKATLVENKLTFSTKPVHDVWFEFAGMVERGSAKKQTDEGYRVLRGKLTQFTTDSNKKTSAKARDVVFKSFPKETGDDQ